MTDREQEYIFTFGCGQQHFGCFVAIGGLSFSEARAEMFRRFGSRWSMQYDSREEAGVERWGLRELKWVNVVADTDAVRGESMNNQENPNKLCNHDRRPTIVKLTTQVKKQAAKSIEPERLWCKDEDLGEYYTPICPNCKNELKPLNNFCSHCGSPLDWSKMERTRKCAGCFEDFANGYDDEYCSESCLENDIYRK